MARTQLEHIMCASAGTANLRDIVVVGSQSILGRFPDAAAELLVSMEADVFPLKDPNRSDVIEGAIGENSIFHDTFKYHAHGVGLETATLPDNWRDRLIKVETPATMGAIGWCLEPHDLAVSKLVAGREKDLHFVGVMLRQGYILPETVRERLADTPRLSAERLKLALGRLDRLQNV